MPERITKIDGSADYYPFAKVTNLKFPNSLGELIETDEEDEDTLEAARDDFEVYGVRGEFSAYFVLPKHNQITPLGDASLVVRVKEGVVRLLEAPLSFGIRPFISSNEEYKAMLKTKALITLGSEVYNLECVDDSYRTPESNNIEHLAAMNEIMLDRTGREVSVVIPSRIPTLQRVRVNFINPVLEMGRNLNAMRGRSPI